MILGVFLEQNQTHFTLCEMWYVLIFSYFSNQGEFGLQLSAYTFLSSLHQLTYICLPSTSDDFHLASISFRRLLFAFTCLHLASTDFRRLPSCRLMCVVRLLLLILVSSVLTCFLCRVIPLSW
jgi:hypothetical protein